MDPIRQTHTENYSPVQFKSSIAVAAVAAVSLVALPVIGLIAFYFSGLIAMGAALAAAVVGIVTLGTVAALIYHKIKGNQIENQFIDPKMSELGVNPTDDTGQKSHGLPLDQRITSDTSSTQNSALISDGEIAEIKNALTCSDEEVTEMKATIMEIKQKYPNHKALEKLKILESYFKERYNIVEFFFSKGTTHSTFNQNVTPIMKNLEVELPLIFTRDMVSYNPDQNNSNIKFCHIDRCIAAVRMMSALKLPRCWALAKEKENEIGFLDKLIDTACMGDLESAIDDWMVNPQEKVKALDLETTVKSITYDFLLIKLSNVEITSTTTIEELTALVNTHILTNETKTFKNHERTNETLLNHSDEDIKRMVEETINEVWKLAVADYNDSELY